MQNIPANWILWSLCHLGLNKQGFAVILQHAKTKSGAISIIKSSIRYQFKVYCYLSVKFFITCWKPTVICIKLSLASVTPSITCLKTSYLSVKPSITHIKYRVTCLKSTDISVTPSITCLKISYFSVKPSANYKAYY